MATYAEIRGGTAQVFGAFFEWFGVPKLPASPVLYVVVQLELDRGELGVPFELAVLLHRPPTDCPQDVVKPSSHCLGGLAHPSSANGP